MIQYFCDKCGRQILKDECGYKHNLNTNSFVLCSICDKKHRDFSEKNFREHLEKTATFFDDCKIRDNDLHVIGPGGR